MGRADFFSHFSAWLCVDSRRRRRIDPGSSRLWRHRRLSASFMGQQGPRHQQKIRHRARAALDQRRRAQHAGIARWQHSNESELGVIGAPGGTARRTRGADRGARKSHAAADHRPPGNQNAAATDRQEDRHFALRRFQRHWGSVGVAGVEDRSAPGYDAPVRRDQRAHDRPDFRPDRRDDPFLSRKFILPASAA